MIRKIPEVRQTIPLAGSQMSVLRAGEGTPVLLAHSYLWDAEMWRPQIDRLSHCCSLIIPELWGHGESGPLPGDTRSLSDVAGHHIELLDRLDIDSCILVGLSVGGMWGVEMALAAPDRVEAIVLMDTFVGAEMDDRRAMYDGLLDAVAASGRVTPAMLDVIVPLFFSHRTLSDRPGETEAFRRALSSWPADRILDSLVPLGRMIFGRREALPDLGSVIGPALVMTGADDLSRPAHEGLLMSQVLDCPFIEIPHAGHIASLEAPEIVSKALEDFISSVVDGRVFHMKENPGAVFGH